MKEYSQIVEELAEMIIDETEYRDELAVNTAFFTRSLDKQINDKVLELATDRFCSECHAKLKTVMADADGTNLEEVMECSNPDCTDTD